MNIDDRGEVIELTDEQEELFDAFLDEYGDDRVIAVNGKIHELIELMFGMSKNQP